MWDNECPGILKSFWDVALYIIDNVIRKKLEMDYEENLFFRVQHNVSWLQFFMFGENEKVKNSNAVLQRWLFRSITM